MAALLNYGLNTNLNGVNGFARKPANSNGTLIGIYSARLAATTDTSLTVPNVTGKGELAQDTPTILAVFGYENGSTVFVGQGGTALPNTTAPFVASSSAIKPEAFLVKGGSVLHFYALAQAYISVEFYAVT